VDHDPAGMKHVNGNLPVICARARLIDNIARRFLDRRPDAVVLHLSCGLDSRVMRLAPGLGVTSATPDLSAVAASCAGLVIRDETSLISAAAHAGTRSAAIRLVDAVPAGHRVMVLRTYDLPDDTVTAE
jgi:hypothetical protein